MHAEIAGLRQVWNESRAALVSAFWTVPCADRACCLCVQAKTKQMLIAKVGARCALCCLSLRLTGSG